MKHFIKKIIKQIFSLFVKIIYTKQFIIFESVPNCDNSPWMIYKELKKRSYHKKYNFIWATDKDFHKDSIRCIPFFGKLSRVQSLFKKFYVYKAKAIIQCNRNITKYNNSTFKVHTCHGGVLKQCSSYMKSIDNVDAFLTLSEDQKKLFAIYVHIPLENFCVLGYPCNDNLFLDVDLYANNFWQKTVKDSRHFKHIIGWLPTFRIHRCSTKIGSGNILPMGIPLIQNETELENLNNYLQSKNILLAIQIHHAQLINFPEKNFSNIVFISQQLKYNMNVSTMNLMHSFDALITDYSAAYYEFLLLNRPIALSIDDFEIYKEHNGFVLDYFDYIKGVYLKTIKDLLNFIDDVDNGIDSAKEIREKSLHRIHKYIDDQSTKRVVDYLIKRAKL